MFLSAQRGVIRLKGRLEARQSVRRRLGWALVRGNSMEPTLSAGDRLLVSHGAKVRAGDLVVARFGDDALVIKRAVQQRPTPSGEQGWWLLSDNPEVGVDSRHVWQSPRLACGRGLDRGGDSGAVEL